MGYSKAECAAVAVKKMNPEVNIEPVKLRVDPGNISFFSDYFWDELDFVVNAVDNIKARLYVD